MYAYLIFFILINFIVLFNQFLLVTQTDSASVKDSTVVKTRLPVSGITITEGTKLMVKLSAGKNHIQVPGWYAG